MELFLFQTAGAYAQVRHTGCLVLSGFPSPQPGRGAPRRLSGQNHFSSSRLHRGQGWGGSGPAYITVAVGNHIHQIKSSIYLCGSGDSGGGAGALAEGEMSVAQG